MQGEIIGALVVVIIIGVGLAIYKNARTNALKNDGMIVEREHNFFKNYEIIETKKFTFDDVVKEVEKVDFKKYKIGYEIDKKNKIVRFIYGKMRAEFCEIGAKGKTHTYKLSITRYEYLTTTGFDKQVMNKLEMNAVLTIMEKICTKLDEKVEIESFTKQKSKPVKNISKKSVDSFDDEGTEDDETTVKHQENSKDKEYYDDEI